MKTRHWLHQDGERTLARFDHSTTDRPHTVLYMSAQGTAQSRAYKSELTNMLKRAGQSGLVLKRVAVESRTTGDLSLGERTVKLTRDEVPGDAQLGRGAVDLSSMKGDEVDALRKRIGTRAAQVGRAPGAKGSGNSHKTLRLYFGDDLTTRQVKRLAGEGK